MDEVTATYSRAVDLTATLLRVPDGTPVTGGDLQFTLRDESGTMNVDLGHGPADPAGRVTVRVPLVNGCPYLGNAVLVAGPQASPVPYVVEARFAGDTLSGVALAPSVRSAALRLVKERAQVKIVQGTQGVLGEPLTITAKVEDPDGDAPCDRSALTGPAPTTVEGITLAFFMNVHPDTPNPTDYSDPGESLGTAVTSRGGNPQAEATASVTADTTPTHNLPAAGVDDQGLMVQLPASDPRYLPASAVGRRILLPAPVAPARCTLAADPTSAPAGQTVVVWVTLRDAYDNPLGRDVDPHDVKLSLEGSPPGARLAGQVTRDPDTGRYWQQLEGPSFKGTVTVRVTVDGQAGASLDVTFTGVLPVGPCACTVTPHRVPWTGWVAATLGLLARRRTRTRAGDA
jgi:hypothetical protein